MVASSDKPFVIVGGGIGGLAAALALSKRGHKVEVLEQASAFAEVGAGIQMGPNSYRALLELGVGEAAKALAVLPEALVMQDAVSGEPVARIPLEPFEARFGAPYAVIHRADLHSALLQACRETPRVSLRTGARLVDYSEADGVVTVHAEGGDSLQGRALIGADGLWSRVRQQTIGDGPPRISGHIAYRAVLPTSEVPEHLRLNEMRLWAGPKCHLVQYPLRGGDLFNLVAVFHSDRYEEGWDSYGDPAELQLRFQHTCPEVRALLAKIESWRMWVLCDREPAAQWGQGAVTLLGDAAHPMLQYLAQGAGMAMEDALCIANCVELEPDVASAFRRYEEARYRRTGRAQLSARLYGEFFHAEGVRRELRNNYLSKGVGYEGLAWLYDYPVGTTEAI